MTFVIQSRPVLESIPTKDIAIAVLGGSAAIASILLIFVGFLMAHAESFPAEIDNRVRKKYTTVGKLGIIPLVCCVAVMLASYGWLFNPSNYTLFWIWSKGFWAVSGLFLLYAVVAIVLL